jgi:hypothetical protein
VRRRARFLRKARELAYRDLGGLVFDLHRFGQRNDALVLNKLNTLGHIDAELRTLETALGERDTVTVLREAGITACPRCAAIHSGDDRFCPNCGLSMSRHVELPIAGAPVAVATPTPAGEPAQTASAPAAQRAGFTSGEATASWPVADPGTPGAAAEGQAAGATAAAATPGAASTPGSRPVPAHQAPVDPASSSEEDKTEILHPLEPDK